ncbi:L-rhamnose-binding lectin SML-like [Stylophora pistillata]|uniref:L-rhamnose-binding lectin SML-like n=1 Tax=Stylophora pistillata TaxID=50429 RepID=UPI000C0477D5|nr:L-rhamnose-binding lectin SML-like [Stylophora pistillata]
MPSLVKILEANADIGYLQWEGWSACPDVCGIRYHQVRRRICQNPTTTIGGGDCSGRKSETRESGCYKECLDRNSTTYEFLTANLSCPNGTFININSIYYGREQENASICDSSGLSNDACVPPNDTAGHNRAQVYERCQMRSNCTIEVSNDTFLDPCPGFRKQLKIHFI